MNGARTESFTSLRMAKRASLTDLMLPISSRSIKFLFLKFVYSLKVQTHT